MSEIPIIIVGAGKHGLELDSYLLDAAQTGSPLRLAGYVDEHRAPGPWGSSRILGNLETLRELAWADPSKSLQYITAVGDNRARREVVGKLEALGCPNLVPGIIRHPFTSVGGKNEIGEGTCLAPGSIISTEARLGRHVIMNMRALVSHECIVEDYVNLNPGCILCGNVHVEEGAYIGPGATVIRNLTIGAWAVVAAGATVFTNVAPRVTVMGAPARRMLARKD
jgi:acetyltransferase EpsM